MSGPVPSVRMKWLAFAVGSPVSVVLAGADAHVPVVEVFASPALKCCLPCQAIMAQETLASLCASVCVHSGGGCVRKAQKCLHSSCVFVAWRILERNGNVV